MIWFLFLLFFFSFSHIFYFDKNEKNGATPLWVAVFIGHEQIVEKLLEKGANVDLANKVLLIVSFEFV